MAAPGSSSYAPVFSTQHSKTTARKVRENQNSSGSDKDNALFIALARHSVPVIRVLWLSPVLSERKEAKDALGRVAAVLCDRWRRDGNNANWRWYAGPVYRDATRECRWQLIDASPPPFLQHVADELWSEELRRLSLTRAARRYVRGKP